MKAVNCLSSLCSKKDADNILTECFVSQAEPEQIILSGFFDEGSHTVDPETLLAGSEIHKKRYFAL